MLTPLALLALAGTFAGALVADVQPSQVRVGIPLGMTAGFSATTAAPDGALYVTVDTVSARNPSSVVQFYDANEFRLLVGEHTYATVVRPGLAGLDFSGSRMVQPNDVLRVTVTFEVPSDTTAAKLEFLPHWFDDHGASVAFCCYYP